MNQAARKPARAKPEPKPGFEYGDEIYVHHEGQPCTASVVSTGATGVRVQIGADRHTIKWPRVLGHKKRAEIRGEVVDEGEDGMIVRDQHGRKRFIGIPEEAKEDPLMIKAFGQRAVLLFMKAGPLANRPGLTQRDITDKNGVVIKRWVRANPDQPKKREPGDPPEAGAEHGFGTHNLGPGDKVTFAAGDFKGSGVIVGSPGNAGVHVKDSSGREHRVRWTEITGHDDKGGAEKPPVDRKEPESQAPIPGDTFKAADYAKQHDDESVTPESILQHFPPDTKEKIQAVQERLKTIEQTIDQHKSGDAYRSGRQAVHRKIYSALMSPEKIAAAVPPPGQKPTLTILGGRGGSGKSWFEGQVYDPSKAIKLDADEIKGMLPEYEGWNAAQVHEESSDVMSTIMTAAREQGLNVVLDGTLATKKSAMQKLEAFKGDGYRIEAHYMHLPRQEAAKRAVSRFLGKTNRYVPVDVVLANRENEANFDEIRKHADKWSFRDNNVPHGQEPKLISEGGADGENPTKKDA